MRSSGELGDPNFVIAQMSIGSTGRVMVRRDGGFAIPIVLGVIVMAAITIATVR